MIKLDEWQEEVLAYRGDLLLCTGRRVGKTYILARKAVDRMIKEKANVIIFSLTEEQAMIILSMAVNYLLETAPHLLSKKKIDTNKKTLTLKNGAKMRCRPAGDTGDSGRGFEGGIVIVDEASRMGKLFWIAILPIILMKAGEVWISSTPFGKTGYFWERYNEAVNLKDPEARYKVFYVTTEEVIKTRKLTNEWTEEHREKVLKILAMERKDMSESEYGQEYMGLFVEELQRMFNEDWIEKVCVAERGNATSGRYYLGVDVAGFGKDKNTFELFRKISKDEIIQTENIVTEHKLTTQTADKIRELDKSFNIKEIGIDDGGLGFGVYSDLVRERHFLKRTFALNNSSRPTDAEGKKTRKVLKEEMYQRVASTGERGILKILKDENIKLSLRSIQWELVKKDNSKTEVRIFGKESHITEGIIRAVWLATEDKTLNIWAY